MQIGYWGDTPSRESDAKGFMEILWWAYPGHPWFVKVYEGVIFIRWLGIDGNWGMVLKTKDICHDAAVIKRELIFMAGEWLERAGLARGRYDDAEVTKVEGVPEVKTVKLAETTAEISTEPLRETPRPQVQNG